MKVLNEKEIARLGPMASFNVKIDYDVYQKIMFWVNKAPGEVSGLGKVVIDSDGTFTVKSAMLFSQENTGSSTELDGAEIAKAMYDLRDEPGHLNFWWHSHANMGVFWSGTDIDTIRQIGQNGFVLSTVFNKKAEKLTAFYAKAGEAVPEIFINTLPCMVEQYLNEEDVIEWNAEYAAKVKEKSWSYGNYGTYTSGKVWDSKTTRWVDPTEDDKSFSSKYDYDDSEYWFDRRSGYPHDSRVEPDSDKAARAHAIIGAIKDGLETLAQKMDQETKSGKARKVLNRICEIINKAKIGDDVISYDLKKIYLDRYNLKHGSASKSLAIVGATERAGGYNGNQ